MSSSDLQQVAFDTSEHIAETRRLVADAKARGLTVGCVPTMGALHEGHLSLIEAARRDCGFVVATVFVNPTQFGPGEDFEKYPRPLEADLDACRRAGVHLVFHPQPSTMYPEHDSTIVEVQGLSTILEGEHRPGHFRGVATVVTKLLNIVGADRAYFGQKDYQQQLLIRTMCRDLQMPVQIVTCPIIRDADGLALSSRNVYLSADERQAALALSQSLNLAAEAIAAGHTDLSAIRRRMLDHLAKAGVVRIDYATIADTQTLAELATPQEEMVALVAAHVVQTRLIDNRVIRIPHQD